MWRVSARLALPFSKESIARMFTVVNRSGQVAQATWDGQHYELGPHATEMFEELVAHKFKANNPLMGSLDPRTGQITCRVGIKELGDPIQPLTADVLINPTTGKPHVEVWDRNKLTGARPSEIVEGDNGLYSAGDWKSPQSTDLNFDGR